jgi:formiminoglutamase
MACDLKRAHTLQEDQRVTVMADDPFDPNLSETRRWLSIADLLGSYGDAKIAVIGAPLAEGSLTPGRCDLAPAAIRAALKRLSVFDIESGIELRSTRVHDAGDLDLKGAMPKDALVPIRDAVSAETKKRALTILLGGNNAVTRSGVHGLDPGLKKAGLLTLDAHFDLRDTDQGLTNGNPVAALLEDGLDGRRISQIGLAPFANTKKAFDKAVRASIAFHTLARCRELGFVKLVKRELDRLASLCETIYVDFDIDVIDRAHMPAAPGARPGGISSNEFFAATRAIVAHPKVKAIDLAEFDPSLDVSDIGALTAARWLAEVLAGFSLR